jgi:predicted DNA-binding protein (MmcQ/YjbR family)
VAKYRAFVLSLPEAKEEIKWGSPHFTVLGKIFSGLSEDGGEYFSGVVVHPDLAASLVDDVMYSVAPYTGRYGGITMNVSKVPLEQARRLVQMSYSRSAPARLVKLLEAAEGAIRS